MSRVDIGYKKDQPCVVRIRTSHAPYESMTAEQAREFAAELIRIAQEVDSENKKMESKLA